MRSKLISSFAGGVALLFSLVFPRVGCGSGFIDLNVYPELTDVNVDSVATVNIFAKLPQRFHYFSLTNFINRGADTEFSGDYNYFTEQNLRWAVWEDRPIDLTAQWNLRSGSDNDRFRLGWRWRLDDTPSMKSFFDSIHLSYSVTFHAIQFDHQDAYVWQMEHVFRKTFPELSDRLYLAGFVDHYFGEDRRPGIPTNPFVGEAQLGWRLVDDLYLISEYRINQYRRSDTNNLAFGLEYILKW